MGNLRKSSAIAALVAMVTVSACDRGEQGSIVAPGGEPEYAAMDTTFASNTNRTFVQLERLGNPLVSEVLLEKREHPAHNAYGPFRDPAHFTDDIVEFAVNVAKRPPAFGQAVAAVLLGTMQMHPGDMIHVHPTRAAGVTAMTANTAANMNVGWLTHVLAPNVGYGGRKLAFDDVVDKALGVFFGSVLAPATAPGLATDNVDSTNPAPMNSFPYFPGPNPS